MYTPKTVSEMLDIPASTLRRYSADFGEYLSESARRQGAKREYTDTDVILLRRIRQLVRERKPPEQIAAALAVVETEQTEQQTSALALLPDVLDEFERLRAALAEMARRQSEQNEQHEQELSNLRAELSETQNQLRQVHERLNTPWWKRLRRQK